MGKGRDRSPDRIPIEPEYVVPQAVPGEPVLHPLKEAWTFWFLLGDRSIPWSENLVKIGTVETVEDFWRYYNHTRKPSQLEAGQDLSFFKAGIEPMWEDPGNKNGGQWVIRPWVGKEKASEEDVPSVDFYWRETLMALVGGLTFMNVDHNVCGATFCKRSKAKERFALWTANANAQDLNLAIARRWKEVLKIETKISYEDHANANQTQRSAGSRRPTHYKYEA